MGRINQLQKQSEDMSKGIVKNLQRKGEAAVSKTIAAAVAVVIIVLLSAGAYYSYVNARNTEQVSSATITTVIVPMTYHMWQSIAERNVSAIMTEYSHNYEAVWWFFNGSATLTSINGKHDCNLPIGPGNCSRSVLAIWEAFANNSIPFKYRICEANFSQGTENWFYSRGTMWLVSYSGNETVRLPIQTDLRYVNNTWSIYRVWFGLPGEPAVLMRGNVTHVCPPNQYS